MPRTEFHVCPTCGRNWGRVSTKPRILKFLDPEVAWTSEDISEMLGISTPTVRKHLNELEAEGVVVGVRTGSPSRLVHWRLVNG